MINHEFSKLKVFYLTLSLANLSITNLESISIVYSEIEIMTRVTILNKTLLFKTSMIIISFNYIYLTEGLL